jgi:probable F420-dependent oxidoreductase
VTVARAAEHLDFAGLWTFERLLRPVGPNGQDPYGLPDHNASVYDPLETLTWVAAHTERIRLGTIVMDSLFQTPIVLAKRLATLDRLSGGRLSVGLGQGWLPEEFVATGVPMTRRGAGFEQHLAAMRACWGPDPVEHQSALYRIPRSQIGPKPVNGQIPVLLGGTTPAAVERAARLGDGFAGVFLDWATLGDQIRWYREADGEAPIVLRVNPEQIDAEGSEAPFTGTLPSLIDDLARARSAGVEEVVWDLSMAGLAVAAQVAMLERVASELAEARSAP